MSFEVENRAMFRPPETSTITAHGDTFAQALENLLDTCKTLTFETTDPDGDVSARFHAEAATLAELVLHMLEAMFAVAADNDLGIARVSVDGYRPLAEGHRAWGTAELAPNRTKPETIELVSTPAVEQVDTCWQISVRISD